MRFLRKLLCWHHSWYVIAWTILNNNPCAVETLEQCEWCGKQRRRIVTEPQAREYIGKYLSNRYSMHGLPGRRGIFRGR